MIIAVYNRFKQWLFELVLIVDWYGIRYSVALIADKKVQFNWLIEKNSIYKIMIFDMIFGLSELKTIDY